MDQTATNIIAYVAFISGLGSGVYTALNHRRIRSSCCGRKMEASLDIEQTTPPRVTPAVLPPIKVPPVIVE
jgi:hypothetical protein